MYKLRLRQSYLSFGAFGCYGVSLLFFIICFCSNHWWYLQLDGKVINMGLWTGCWSSTSGESKCSSSIFDDKHFQNGELEESFALKADSFTHVHPYLIYILNRNITWIASKTFWYSNRRSVTFYKHYRICFYRRRQWLVSWGPDPHDVFSNCHFSTRVRSYRIPVYQWSREVPTETRRCCLRIFCCNR